ncbi:MAG TPA: nucleotidyltransferase family protein [Streptosporangiaceae bacterium]|nr:nucleotidyltransferase family protein [Streptosporangiaceae bacterium]
MKPNLGLAARTLALDLATGEVVRGMDAAGIDCMVLKGPAMAHRLYADAPGCRNYGDIDLLVAPWHFGDAGRVLASLGFEDQLPGIRASETARMQGHPWRRHGAAHIVVDLHRGFHNVADWPAWWDLLSARREVLVVEGQPVAIPDQAGCALVAALHASTSNSGGKALEDLRRALRLFDDDVWRQAAGLAGSVDAGGAFAAALCRHSAGAELATRLGLTVTDPVAWFRATSRARGTGSLSLVLEPGTWAARAQRLRDVAFPSAAVFAGRWPTARRGRAGLAAAHLGRLCVSVTRLPQLLLAWRRTSRAPRRRGAVARELPPPRARRPLRVRAKTAARTTWWTLRTWWQVHRRLASGRWESGALPVTTGPAGTSRPHSGRAAHLVLACCRATCLETALIRQARAAGAGAAIDVVVGVTAPASGFRAHAWLDGDRVDPGFVELLRYPAATAEPGRCRPSA